MEGKKRISWASYAWSIGALAAFIGALAGVPWAANVAFVWLVLCAAGFLLIAICPESGIRKAVRNADTRAPGQWVFTTIFCVIAAALGWLFTASVYGALAFIAVGRLRQAQRQIDEGEVA